MAIYGNIENLDAVILGDITAEPIHIDGEDGRGIESVTINSNQHLIVTYTDDTTEDAGVVGEGAGVIIDPTLSIEGAAADALAVGEEVERLNDTLNEISVCVPSQASYSNQLADKAFVNSTVGTNTAYYISNAGQPFTSLAQLQAYSGTVTNNDYAFVVGTDAEGNTTYTRYKYNATTQTWAAEYVLNNSSFTAAQWAAIESGITAALVASYNAHLANDDIHVTAAQKTAWNGKLSDAPSDGKQYARKNGAWIEVQGSSGADNTFVVNVYVSEPGTTPHIVGTPSTTYAQIVDAVVSKKIVTLNLRVDDNMIGYAYPLISANEGYAPQVFGGLIPVNDNYWGAHQAVYISVSSADVWSISYDDYALQEDLDSLDSRVTYLEEHGGGGADTVITGLYDTYEGNVTLDFPTGTTNYFDYINGLFQQDNDVRIEVDAAQGDWTAVFRHSKTSDDGQGRGYHVFQNCELTDDYSTNAGFLRIDATSVTYVQDDRGGGADNTFVVTGEYDGLQWSGIDKTYAQILAAHNADKVVELHLATDERGTELVLVLTAVVDTSGELIFGVVNTYEYFDNKNSYKVVCADDDTWHLSGYDIALKTDIPTRTSDLTNDSGFLTLNTLPIYNGGVE